MFYKKQNVALTMPIAMLIAHYQSYVEGVLDGRDGWNDQNDTMSNEGVTSVVGNYFEIKGNKTQCIVSKNIARIANAVQVTI